MMIIYIRTKPFPKCKYCGERMSYWIPGLPDKEHYHDECFANACVEQTLKKIERMLDRVKEPND